MRRTFSFPFEPHRDFLLGYIRKGSLFSFIFHTINCFSINSMLSLKSLVNSIFLHGKIWEKYLRPTVCRPLLCLLLEKYSKLVKCLRGLTTRPILHLSLTNKYCIIPAINLMYIIEIQQYVLVYKIKIPPKNMKILLRNYM